MLGGTAYVTEPATDALHAVDLATGLVRRSDPLAVTPNEIVAVSGDVEEHDHGDHDH